LVEFNVPPGTVRFCAQSAGKKLTPEGIEAIESHIVLAFEAHSAKANLESRTTLPLKSLDCAN